MSDYCKTQIKNQFKEAIKNDPELSGFLSEDKLDFFIEDIKNQKTLWGSDVAGYKKSVAAQVKRMEAARRIYTQKREFNKLAVANQNRFIQESFGSLTKNKGKFSVDTFKEVFSAFSIGGSNKSITGASDGVFDRSNAILQSVAAPLKRRLDELGAWKLLANKEGQQDLVRELHNMQLEGGTGKPVTKNKQMYEAAKAFKSALDGILEAKQAMGMPTKRLDGYIGKQFWSKEKVSEFKDGAEFRKYIESTYKIDEAKTFGNNAGDDAYKSNFYKEMYESIMTTSADGVQPDGIGDEFITVIQTKDLYKKQAQGRKLFFQGADDYNTMINEMGNGNYLGTIIKQLETDSRSVALMSKFGTDPAKGHAAFFHRTKKKFREAALAAGDKKTLAELDSVKYDTRLGALNGSASDMFNYMSGQSFSPGVSVKAKVAQVATGIETLSKLGLSGISALGDLPRSVAMLSAQTGEGYFKTAGTHIRSLVSAIGNNKAVMDHVSTLLEQELHLDGFSAESGAGLGSYAKKLIRGFHISTGLDYVTKKTEQTMAISMNKQFASNAKYGYNNLPAHFKQNYMDRYNISEKGWRVIQALTDPHTGLVDMDNVDTLKGFSAKDRMEAKLGYFKASTDMAKLASGAANSRARFQMTAGKSVDDVEGTARKLVMQFKGFMFSQQHSLARAANSNPDGAFSVKPVAQTVVATVTGYYVSQQIKRLIQGKDLQDMSDPGVIASMFAHSGALLPYGEFLLGSARFGSQSDSPWAKAKAGENYLKGAVTSLAGPSSGLAWDSIEAIGLALDQQYGRAGGTMGRALGTRVPGINTVPAELADRYILKSLLDASIIDTLKGRK